MNVDDDRRRLVHPRCLLVVLDAVHHLRNITEHDGRAVAVGNHNLAIIVAGYQLIVGVDLIILMRSVEVSLGGIDAGLRERRAQVFKVESVRRQRSRIGLNAHGRLLPAADAHQADAAQLRKLGRKPRIHHILNLRERNRVGGDGQRQHRSIRRIGLAINRRRWKARRQKALRGVNRGLNLFLGDVDVEAESELQHNHRRSAGTGRRHLAQPLELAELTFKGSSNRCGHHVRAGAWIESQHLDGRVINLRQGGNRQLGICNNTHQQDCRHQQRRGYRALDERPGWIHGARLPTVFSGGACFAATTLLPACNLSKLLVATTSPGLIPVTEVMPPSATPVVILRTLTTPFAIT